MFQSDYRLVELYDPTDFGRIIAKAVFHKTASCHEWRDRIEQEHYAKLKSQGEPDYIIRNSFDVRSIDIEYNPS